MKRRQFIQHLGVGSMMLGASAWPIPLRSKKETTAFELAIFHTGDTHGRPLFSEVGKGGLDLSLKWIEELRKAHPHSLLLDTGDFLKGSTTFQLTGGWHSINAMNTLAYDAGMLGEVEFYEGLEVLEDQITSAAFPFISSNHLFGQVSIAKHIRPWAVFEKGDLKIGILGVGQELKGKVPPHLYEGMELKAPIQAALETSAYLKNFQQCDYILCLSRLGLQYPDGQASDRVLAQQSEYIDLILGGHTHTYMDQAVVSYNRHNRPVLISHCGKGGEVLGELKLSFGSDRKLLSAQSTYWTRKFEFAKGSA